MGLENNWRGAWPAIGKQEGEKDMNDQMPLIDQPITLVDVAAYLEAYHAARDAEAEQAEILKELKDDTKEALKNLRKIRQRVNSSAAKEDARAMAEGFHKVLRDNGATVTVGRRTNRETGEVSNG